MSVIETRNEVMRFGSNASTRIYLADQNINPRGIVDFVDRAPGVVKNGQNGLFQVFSIRGVSGHRVQTRFSGVPIATERRAGTAASFIDPWFIEYADVVRGPSSTFFGSGAIGGVLLTEPNFYSGVEVDLGYEADSTQRNQSLGMGSEHWSLGFSHRSAADGESPAGTLLHTGFQQDSAMLQNRWEQGNLQFSGLLLSSRGSDIGRSNIFYPERRVSEVAEDDHDLLNMRVTYGAAWTANLYIHEQYSKTNSIDFGESQINVENDSLDWGGRWSSSWSNRSWSGEFGAELDTREGVDASEYMIDSNGYRSGFRANLNASQKSYGLFTTTTFDMSGHSIQFGIRHDWLQQEADNQRRISTNKLTGYIGWQWFINQSWSISSELANAYREPSLTERYYSGSTARGSSVGNVELKAETAPGFDLGLHWEQGSTVFSAHWFYQSFDNYIERTIIDSDTRGFGNLRDGEVTGVELEGSTLWRDQWAFTFGFHWVDGEGSGDTPIADIPASVVNIGATYRNPDWQLGMHWRYRFSKSSVASTELPIDAANIVDIHYTRQLSSNSYLSIYFRNALNDDYRISADEISTYGNRHTLGIRFRHRFN